jgi:hypothetical protein
MLRFPSPSPTYIGQFRPTHSLISATRSSISVIGDCRAKVRPDPPPPAVGREGVVVCSGALSFASYDAMLDHCRNAWNWIVDQHWRIMFIGLRDWAYGF